MNLHPDTIAAWEARLAREAEGLDLANEEDRSTFRLRVAQAMKNLRRDAAHALALHLGYRLPGNCSQARAIRGCQEGWLKRATATTGE